MFDLAFSELVVIGIVALVVIGPEKLPKVARGAGKLLGQIQRYVNTVKSDINNELRLEDLQRLQEEIRLNMERGGQPVYQVGEVIDHAKLEMETETLQHKNAANTESVVPLPVKRSMPD
jgi:sec-independent protein translocase protein TatB